MKKEGLILKGIGGFYYVETDTGIYECKAKGKFRNKKVSPVAGDKVSITVRDSEENTIDLINERKNKLTRPPVANIDKLLIAVSVVKPFPNTLIIDKMTVLAEKNNITPFIVITKTDLENSDELYRIYKSAGYNVYRFSKDDHSELPLIKAELKNCLTAFTGNSGVGKSTLINALSDGLMLETGEISDKLGRGRHTTRQAEIHHVADGLVIDTAGFSSVEFINDDIFLSEDLQYYFNEFNEYIGECKFIGCSHTGDKGCKIHQLVEEGIISKSRYESYLTMYNDMKNIKKWQI
ncbi:MAG: ribosome small subunit-dependent GTPase A [Acutalibacteraceae bacterium]|nr:ribosome small subunit-dependent GTPase A [Acutalibacteraceae bacterium]